MTFAGPSPVVVSVAEGPHWDGDGLPHGVQSVLHHLCLMADSKAVAGRASRGRWGRGGRQGPERGTTPGSMDE